MARVLAMHPSACDVVGTGQYWGMSDRVQAGVHACCGRIVWGVYHSKEKQVYSTDRIIVVVVIN